MTLKPRFREKVQQFGSVFKQHYYNLRAKNAGNRYSILLLSIVIGFAAGLSALLLKTYAFSLRNFLLDNIEIGDYNIPILVLPGTGILLVVLMKHFILRDNIKHNISMILYAISQRNGLMRTHKILSSLAGGILTAGFGGSAGLESPIISSGSAIGSSIGKVLRLNYKTNTLLLACGAAGGISAIFNTPITGIVFALEVLLIDLTRFSLIPLLMASVSGSITAKLFFSEKILFDFVVTDSFHSSHIPFYLILGVLLGLVSWYFTRTYLHIEKYFDGITKASRKLFIGSVVLGIMLFFFPPLYGEGFQTVTAALSSNYGLIIPDVYYNLFDSPVVPIITFFAALILLKGPAAAVTISAGGIGGIFAPALFTGAATGLLFAYSLNYSGVFGSFSESNFIMVGMAGVLSGVLHAPLTGIFLIAEITGGYELIVPLMMVSTISYIVAKVAEPNSIVTKQLVKRGELITHHKDKAVLTFLQLKSLIETDFVSVSPQDTLGDLTKSVAASSRNLFPVVDSEGMFMGVILLDNIREIMFNTKMYQRTTVENLLTIPPDYIDTTDNMQDVVAKFNETDAWNLPVLENGKYVGFISKSKMFSAYRKLLVEISDD